MKCYLQVLLLLCLSSSGVVDLSVMLSVSLLLVHPWRHLRHLLAVEERNVQWTRGRDKNLRRGMVEGNSLNWPFSPLVILGGSNSLNWPFSLLVILGSSNSLNWPFSLLVILGSSNSLNWPFSLLVILGISNSLNWPFSLLVILGSSNSLNWPFSLLVILGISNSLNWPFSPLVTLDGSNNLYPVPQFFFDSLFEYHRFART